MLTRPLFPLHFLVDDDDGAGSGAVAPAAAPEPAAPAAEPAATPPAPWAADLEAAFAAEDPRAAVDEFLRTKQQPYITQLEQAKAELEGKAWVFDGLQDDPEATLREIAEQVYDADTAERVVELLKAGATVEDAEAQAVAEAAGAPATDLATLPPEVREAVEFAKAEKERRAAEDAERVSAQELDEATQVYDAWRAEALEDNPHVVENALHAFVHAADGDMEQGLANYLAVFPAPEGQKPDPSPTLGGGSIGGIRPGRPASSLAEAFGDVYDAGHKGTTVL